MKARSGELFPGSGKAGLHDRVDAHGGSVIAATMGQAEVRGSHCGWRPHSDTPRSPSGAPTKNLIAWGASGGHGGSLGRRFLQQSSGKLTVIRRGVVAARREQV